MRLLFVRLLLPLVELLVHWALLFMAPVLTVIALKVGPPEQIMIAVFGLSVVCLLVEGNAAKGLLV